MKVVIAISHSYCANFIRGQAKYLRERGCEVVLVSAMGPEIQDVAEKEGCRLVEIPFSREISLKQDYKSLMKIIRFLRMEKPDVVNAGNPKTGFLFMIASLFFPNTPMIFTLRGLRSDTLVGFKRKIVLFTEWLSCFLAKEVIVISPSLKEHATSIGVLNKVKGIVFGKGSSNGVDLERFHLGEANVKAGINLRAKYSIGENDILVGYVGRVTKDKGVEELYRGFKLAQNQKDNLYLMLVGPIENDDPISSETMEEMENDRDVIFLERQDDITKIYPAFDLLVLFSHREGFGNVALEASAMGKPVIVSDISGARDTVEANKTGILVPVKNYKKLSQAILFYANNPEIRKDHGKYGIERSEKYFSSSLIWDEQFNLYCSLVKGIKKSNSSSMNH